MKCPNCQSTQIRKNGHCRGKQNYHCKKCGRRFIQEYTKTGYPSSVRENCLKMYVNGLGFRVIERVTGANHNTVIRRVRASANAPSIQEIPEISKIGELQTNISDVPKAKLWKSLWLLWVKKRCDPQPPKETKSSQSDDDGATRRSFQDARERAPRKNKKWLWTVANHWRCRIILAWVLGDRSTQTFKPLWKLIRGWQSFFYVTRTHSRTSRLAEVCAYALRWKVYPCIDNCARLVLKTYTTGIEGENTRLRHCALERTPTAFRQRSWRSSPKLDVALQRRIDIRRLLASKEKLFVILNANRCFEHQLNFFFTIFILIPFLFKSSLIDATPRR